MKKLILGLAFFSAVTVSFAQEKTTKQITEHHMGQQDGHHRKNHKQHHQEMVQRMKTDLNLSDEQVSQLEKLHQKHQKERETFTEKNKAERKKFRENHQAEMKKILTSEQYQKWEKMKTERQIKYGGHHQIMKHEGKCHGKN